MDNELEGTQQTHTTIGPLRFAERLLNGVCVTILTVMVMVTTIDVIGRYVFHSPIHGAYESNEFLLAILIFSALPQVTLHNQHLTVSLLDGVLSKRAKHLQRMIISLISGGGLAILSYYLWLHAIQLADYGDRSNALDIPIAPIAYIISVLTGFAAVAALSQLFAHHRQP